MDGKCKGQTDLFFEPSEYAYDDSRKEPGKHARIATAKAICMECDVRVECLEWAMRAEIEFGIFGGKTASDRLDMRKAVKREARRLRRQELKWRASSG
jgi:hypothetical protein